MSREEKIAKEYIEKAESFIVVTDKSMVVYGSMLELMVMIDNMLTVFMKKKVIDEIDLDFIIKNVKEEINSSNKNEEEDSLMNSLRKAFNEAIKESLNKIKG